MTLVATGNPVHHDANLLLSGGGRMRSAYTPGQAWLGSTAESQCADGRVLSGNFAKGSHFYVV